MAEHAAQEQNRRKPIMFTTPGFQPDVRLVVFDQELHVHSILLKLYSAYFRKFLDSPDKTPKVANAFPIGTAVEENLRPAATSQVSYNGIWYLTAAKSDTANSIQSAVFSGDESLEIKAFEILLSAIYLKPYVIDSGELFLSLTQLADFYCALPVISRTLDMAFHISPEFIKDIPRFRCKVFTAVAKLKNKLLFRESLIWVVGPWSEPAYNTLDNPRLKKIARAAWAEVAAKISEIHCQLTQDIGEEAQALTVDTPAYFRSFYRILKRSPFDIDDEFLDDIRDNEVATLIASLLKSNLVLNRDALESGTGSDLFPPYYLGVEDGIPLDEFSPNYPQANMEDHFLCVEIDDEDLPWDVNETDF
ncbi:hypothetical protein BKA64DRAFT_641261 [Cadophora sp. MPI-SDFR-AT-0126]|nr:hypothetical protein BKA64DRAFT_641261 [Leotiomycetes sp. MPI-SDFR-AT-0126]